MTMTDSTVHQHKRYYQAFQQRDVSYDGIFFVAVKTTGIFCRPSCSARKPKENHCLFFASAHAAMAANFRPCRRCHPLAPPHGTAPLVDKLLRAIISAPEKRWCARDFHALCGDMSTARRQFKRRFGVTPIAYARSYRLGMAGKKIQRGEKVIEAQLSSGYESDSGFRGAFSRVTGGAPSSVKNKPIWHVAWLDTPLGPVIAVADDKQLRLLEFSQRDRLQEEIDDLGHKAIIVPGYTEPLHAIKDELKRYFAGTLQAFRTPVAFHGTPFQQSVWETLCAIPYGKTWSYAQVANSIKNPKAVRAVGSANGANPLVIVVPCHRVINSGGKLGGYGAGIARKKWLLAHEQRVRAGVS